MKTIHYIRIIVIATLLVSCKTAEKIVVTGKTGTEIYNPENLKLLGKCDATGKAKIRIPDSEHYAFLLSKSPNSSQYIPFALEHKKSNHFGDKLFFWTTFYIPGLNFAAVSRITSDSYYYNYKYQKKQYSPDINFTKAIFNEPTKKQEENGSTTNNSLANSEKVVSDKISEESSTSKRTISSKSTRTLRNDAKQIEGIYVGTGTLSKGDYIVESYPNITIEVTRVSNNTVNVNVLENGNRFFESPSKYRITKSDDELYLLRHANIKDAVISISADKYATYSHPKVNIDGELYCLKITGKIK